MVATRRLNQLTEDALDRLDLPSGPVTVGLSGGADSAALALLLVQARRDVDAVHIHHGFPASDRLAAAAADIAAALEIRIATQHVDVGVDGSIEEEARNARYRVFDGWGRPLLTAHTLDDNAETILFNLVRGTGAEGLRGVPRHRPPTTWRPLLDITRSETREIATLAGLRFFDDPMNDDPTLTRHRIRHRVLPTLRELNPQVESALARAGSVLDHDSALLDAMTPDVDSAVAVAVVATLPRPLADRVLKRMLDSSGIGATAARMERMRSVARGEAVSQELADGRSVVRKKAMLFIE